MNEFQGMILPMDSFEVVYVCLAVKQGTLLRDIPMDVWSTGVALTV